MRLQNQPISQNFYADELSFAMEPYKQYHHVIRTLPEGPGLHASLQRAVDLYYHDMMLRKQMATGMRAPDTYGYTGAPAQPVPLMPRIP